MLNLLVDASEWVERFMAERIRNAPVEDVEFDEVRAFVGYKEKTKVRNGIDDSQLGDSYAWIAFERHAELVLCWQLDRRTGRKVDAFGEKFDKATVGS